MKKKKTTILIGSDGLEYVINGGKIVEKCLHKTVTDESKGNLVRKICHDCKKVLIHREENKQTPSYSIEDFSRDFKSMHGRKPSGIEISANFL